MSSFRRGGPRTVVVPSRLYSLVVAIFQIFALAGVTYIWFDILKPNVFDSLQGGAVIFLLTLLPMYGLILLLGLIIRYGLVHHGAGGMGVMLLAPLATNSTIYDPSQSTIAWINTWQVTAIFVGGIILIAVVVLNAILNSDAGQKFLHSEHGWDG